MVLLWVIPPIAACAAAVIVLVQMQGIAEAASELRHEFRLFNDVHVAVVEARAAAAELHTTAGARRG